MPNRRRASPAIRAFSPLGSAQRQRQDRSEDIGREDRKPSVNERLKDVLNKPREKLEIEDEREQEKDQEVEKDRDIDRDPGLSH